MRFRQYGAGHPLVFTHIPKTAGTSLRASLRLALQPKHPFEGVDMSLAGAHNIIDDLRGPERAGYVLDPADLPADADLVMGHISAWTTRQRYPEADHVSFLRNPQVRLLSQWLHGRSLSEFDLRHYGRAGVVFRLGRLPLRDYLSQEALAPNVDNTITRFLAWPHPALHRTGFIGEAEEDDLLEAATTTLDSFGYVDVVENDDAVPGLARWLGRELPVVRLNERTRVPRRYRVDLAAELDEPTRELLGHRHRLDRRLWFRIAEKVLGDAAERVDREAFDSAVRRYDALQHQGVRARPARRLVAAAYDVGYRVRHR